MNVKVIATDLDGTLLYNKLIISKKNTLALKRFIANGGIVCFITGRCFVSAKKFADKFASKTGYKISYLSCLKGAVLYDNINNKFVYEQAINNEVTTEIMQICERNDCSFVVYLKKDLHNRNMWIYGNDKLVSLLNKLRIFPHYFPIKHWDNDNQSYKINIGGFKSGVSLRGQSARLERCYDDIKSFLGNEVEITKTSKYMYEITKLNSNKGESIKMISHLLNIDLKNFAAFGDSNNDLQMLSKVGLPIAIGKKSADLNSSASYVILGWQKNAVSKAINKYIDIAKK